MNLQIRGLHIDEIIIDTDPEETSLELNKNLAGTSQEPLQEEPKKPEPKAESVKAAPKKTAKPIDKGKIGALRKAGWTVAEIADEMKCSAPTVRKVLSEIQEAAK